MHTHTHSDIQTFTGPGSQTDQRRWITSQSFTPGLIMTSACHNMTILQFCHKCWIRWGRGESWTCVYLSVSEVKWIYMICLVRAWQKCSRPSPSYIEMMCGWRRDDMISISRRMWTMSCSSLIFSFRIDLIATWKQKITRYSDYLQHHKISICKYGRLSVSSLTV